MFEIKTKRLLLRDILETDQEVMHRLRSDPQVNRYIDYIRSDTEEQTLGWVQGAIYHNSLTPRLSSNLVIERQSDGQILGWIGIGEAEGGAPSVLDFGYALLPDYWGKGYATEALSAIIPFSFEDLNVEQIYGECDFDNQG